jgi:hypothetical protein
LLLRVVLLPESLLYRGRERLRARLAKHPLLKGRQIEGACLANAGCKQPQQLLAYQYFRSIGAHPDVVIYNETALAMLENVCRGTAVSSPRG